MTNKLKLFRNKWHGDIRPYLRSTYSALQNEALRIQGSADKTIEYKFYYSIHKLLNIKEVDPSGFSFSRLGKNNDGGYLLVTGRNKSLSSVKIAYSLGISDDVSLDLSLAELGYHVFQYDHTIKRLPISNPYFHWAKIGIGDHSANKRLKSLEEILTSNGHIEQNGMFLKCDIEGAEWDMINNSSTNTLRLFDQIAIEFHDLDNARIRENILKALEKLNTTHQCVHIHGNNSSLRVSYNDNLITPNSIEATFLIRDKYHFLDDSSVLPRELDQPCNPDLPEIVIGIWNVD